MSCVDGAVQYPPSELFYLALSVNRQTSECARGPSQHNRIGIDTDESDLLHIPEIASPLESLGGGCDSLLRSLAALHDTMMLSTGDRILDVV